MRSRSQLIILILLCLNSCTKAENEIEKLLQKRWSALEAKNINLYAECISDEYPEREKLIKKIDNNFKKIDSIRVISEKPLIYINHDTATVYQDVRLIITINGNKKDLETRERITLRRTDRGWKIIGGIE